MDWQKPQWLEVLGGSAADLIGGRAAIAIRAAVALWKQATPEADKAIETELDRSSEAGCLPDRVIATHQLALSPDQSLATDFALFLMQQWSHNRSFDSLEDYALAVVYVIRNQSPTLRALLSESVYDSEEIRLIAHDAGVNMSRLRLQGTAEAQWFSLIQHLHTQPPGQTLFLAYLVLRRMPGSDELRSLWRLDD